MLSKWREGNTKPAMNKSKNNHPLFRSHNRADLFPRGYLRRGHPSPNIEVSPQFRCTLHGFPGRTSSRKDVLAFQAARSGIYNLLVKTPGRSMSVSAPVVYHQLHSDPSSWNSFHLLSQGQGSNGTDGFLLRNLRLWPCLCLPSKTASSLRSWKVGPPNCFAVTNVSLCSRPNPVKINFLQRFLIRF